MSDELVIIREAGEADRAYIENAWRATMLALSPACEGADPGFFHGEMTRVFRKLFVPGITLRVACDAKDVTNLVGFCAATGPELHYIYVSGELRRMGIAPKLLGDLPIKRYTFKTRPGLRRLKPGERGWAYTPRFTI